MFDERPEVLAIFQGFWPALLQWGGWSFAILHPMGSNIGEWTQRDHMTAEWLSNCGSTKVSGEQCRVLPSAGLLGRTRTHQMLVLENLVGGRWFALVPGRR